MNRCMPPLTVPQAQEEGLTESSVSLQPYLRPVPLSPFVPLRAWSCPPIGHHSRSTPGRKPEGGRARWRVRTQAQILFALPLSSWVLLNKSHNFSVPQFPLPSGVGWAVNGLAGGGTRWWRRRAWLMLCVMEREQAVAVAAAGSAGPDAWAGARGCRAATETRAALPPGSRLHQPPRPLPSW